MDKFSHKMGVGCYERVGDGELSGETSYRGDFLELGKDSFQAEEFTYGLYCWNSEQKHCLIHPYFPNA